jgi:hypothetical protein
VLGEDLGEHRNLVHEVRMRCSTTNRKGLHCGMSPPIRDETAYGWGTQN